MNFLYFYNFLKFSWQEEKWDFGEKRRVSLFLGLSISFLIRIFRINSYSDFLWLSTE